MKKRFNVAVLIYTSVLVVSAILLAYDNTVLAVQRARFYTMPLLTIANVFAVGPLLWISVGALLSSLFCLFGVKQSAIDWRVGSVCLWGFAIMMLEYTALMLCVRLLDTSNKRMMLTAAMWLVSTPSVFLIPGLLLGIGTTRQGKKSIETDS